jgi:hypothetical protein
MIFYEKPEIRDFGSIAEHTFGDLLSLFGGSSADGGDNDATV